MEIKNKTVVDKIKRNNTYFKEVKMKDFTEIDSKIRMAYSEFNFRPFVYEEIEEFIKTRTDYMNNPNNDTSVDMKDAFDYLYLSTKHAMLEYTIKEADFYRLTNLLREGVE